MAASAYVPPVFAASSWSGSRWKAPERSPTVKMRAPCCLASETTWTALALLPVSAPSESRTTVGERIPVVAAISSAASSAS